MYPTAPAAAAAFGLALVAAPAVAGKIEANCTGMFDLEVYVIEDTSEPQEIAGIGTGKATISEAAIVVTGTFGEWRFDREAGTLYKDGKDSGIYCTYKDR